MVISNNILFRYESKIDGGKLFIFDIEKYKVFNGGIVEYKILKYIQNSYDIEKIVDEIQKEFHINNCKIKVDNFINYLKKNKYLI